jgi:crotonobetainyl-CoA:carnitine CoA-transferase CaiB-like acyl-CoA transferase
MCGIASRQADDRGPQLVRHGLVDKATSYTAAQAITAALFRRERTGRGEQIEVPMMDVGVAFLWPDGMLNYSGLEPDLSDYRDIASSYRVTPTSDGHVVLNAVTTRQFIALSEAMGIEVGDEMKDPQYRGQHGGRIMREIRTRLGELTTEQVVARMHEHGVPCGPVVELADLGASSLVKETGIVREVLHPQLGRLREAGPAARMEGLDTITWRPAPALGAHTDEILVEVGFSPGQVEDLRRAAVVS